jgi:hypothetical protein
VTKFPRRPASEIDSQSRRVDFKIFHVIAAPPATFLLFEHFTLVSKSPSTNIVSRLGRDGEAEETRQEALAPEEDTGTENPCLLRAIFVSPATPPCKTYSRSITDASGCTDDSQELRNHVYDLVLSNIDTLVISGIRVQHHKAPPHPLAQTCKQLRAEFRALYTQDCGKYAKTVQFNIHNFDCYGIDETLKRLGEPHSPRIYELNIRLDNKILSNRFDLKKLIRTGGVFSQSLLEQESLDLVLACESLSFHWDPLELCLSPAAEVLHTWSDELLWTGPVRPEQVFLVRSNKVFDVLYDTVQEMEWSAQMTAILSGRL